MYLRMHMSVTKGCLTLFEGPDHRLLFCSHVQAPDSAMPADEPAQGGAVLLVDMGTYRWLDDHNSSQPHAASAPGPTDKAVVDDVGGSGKYVQHMPQGSGEQRAPMSPNEAGACQEGPMLHLVQALPRSLLPRMMLLPWPLPGCTGDVSVAVLRVIRSRRLVY